MATKRPGSPELIPNPFIKKRNQEWSLRVPDVPARSPPTTSDGTVTSAAIEAGRVVVTDHLAHFSETLSQAVRAPFPSEAPQLSIGSYRALYEANAGSPRGAHFVIHQHDHPVAGTHYDLRLQINETSSASWAVMYGMPGDANSVKLARNATETRVHCLWNHLIETASAATGSLMIWDTGTYTVLPRRSKHAPAIDPSSQPSERETSTGPSDSPTSPRAERTEQEKLHAAFQQRKIKLQLHGTRLPEPYILNLRLTKTEDAEGRAKAKRSAERGRRRRRAGAGKPPEQQAAGTSSESGADAFEQGPEIDEPSVQELLEREIEEGATKQENDASTEPQPQGSGKTAITEAMRRELEELEDAVVRATNAYTGAENTIGSVHQRKWFLSLDREACGFSKRMKRGQKAMWVREVAESRDPGNHEGGNRHTYPFYVRGPEAERSVVTGRLAADVLHDEGVGGFVKRKGWYPVLR